MQKGLMSGSSGSNLDQKRESADHELNNCNFIAPVVYGFTRPSYTYLMWRAWRGYIRGPFVKRLRHLQSTQIPGEGSTDSALEGTVPGTVVQETGQSGRGPMQEVLDLQPGEWVQVRSIEEIQSTLQNGKYKGLGFMPEMLDFCGKKYRVFKNVRSITLESNGEVRKLKSPTVFLEGVYCDGKRHSDCDRSCLLFWREIWLKRVET